MSQLVWRKEATGALQTWQRTNGGRWDTGRATLWAELLQGPLGRREVFLWDKQVEVPASKEFFRLGGVGLRV